MVGVAAPAAFESLHKLQRSTFFSPCCTRFLVQTNFPIELENPHVIKRSQVWAGVVPHGPDKAELSSAYQNRDTVAYKRSLGLSIGTRCGCSTISPCVPDVPAAASVAHVLLLLHPVNLARVVPNGMLVFFPSYTVMKKCVEVSSLLRCFAVVAVGLTPLSSGFSNHTCSIASPPPRLPAHTTQLTASLSVRPIPTRRGKAQS